MFAIERWNLPQVFPKLERASICLGKEFTMDEDEKKDLNEECKTCPHLEVCGGVEKERDCILVEYSCILDQP